MLYVGRTILGYTDKEVGRLTYHRWKQQFDHYQNDYDFKLQRVSYSQAQEMADREAIGQELPG